MKNSYCVYCHTFPNGKRYIGITNNTENRWRNGDGYKHQKKVWNAIVKHGWDNIRHEILIDGITKEKAQELEKKLIAEFDSIQNGYNVSVGGEGTNATYLHPDLLEAIGFTRRRYGTNALIDFVDGGRFDPKLGDLCNSAFEAVQHKKKEQTGRPFSLTDEFEIAMMWYDIGYYLRVNTAIIKKEPLPKYVSPQKLIAEYFGI